MNPIITNARVMHNFTICISQPIRERMKLKKGDQVVLSMDENGEVKLSKGIADLDGLVGIGKNTFKTADGWEKFINKQREEWGK